MLQNIYKILEHNIAEQLNSTNHISSRLVSDLQQVRVFIQLIWFPPPIKLTAIIY